MNAEKKKRRNRRKRSTGEIGATRTVPSIFRCRSGKDDASLREGKGMIHNGRGIAGGLKGDGRDKERQREGGLENEREEEQSDQVRRLSDHSSV